MSQRESLPLFLVISMVLCNGSSAQDSPVANRAGLLAEQSVAAMAKTISVHDLTMTGTATRIAGSEREDGSATLRAMKTGEAGLDLSFASGRRAEVYSFSAKGPQGAWSGPDEKLHPISFHNLLVDPGWFSPLLVLERISAQSRGMTVTYAGDSKLYGRSVSQLHVTAPVAGQNASRHPAWIRSLLQNASEFDVYVDSATLLPSEMTFNLHPDNDMRRNLPVRVLYSDYRAVEGIQVPFHIRKYVNNSLTLDLHVEAATFNTGLTATSFGVQ